MTNTLQCARRARRLEDLGDNGAARMEQPVMNKSVMVLIAGAACLLAVVGASAENKGSDQRIATANDSFATLDRNGDHRLSRSEAGFDRLLSQTFAEIDTDGNGFVSLEEFAAGEKVRAAATNLVNR